MSKTQHKKETAIIDASYAKLVKAMKLSIEELERAKRRISTGEYAYQQGIRADKLDSDGIVGTGFQWAEDDHKKYVEYTEAIQAFTDWIEALEDKGVTITPSMLPTMGEDGATADDD